jgi:hypothetical protein
MINTLFFLNTKSGLLWCLECIFLSASQLSMHSNSLPG